MQELFTENYRTLIRKIKDLNMWGDTWCSWIGRINIVKMSIPPIEAMQSQRNSNSFLKIICQADSKIYMEIQRT